MIPIGAIVGLVFIVRLIFALMGNRNAQASGAGGSGQPAGQPDWMHSREGWFIGVLKRGGVRYEDNNFAVEFEGIRLDGRTIDVFARQYRIVRGDDDALDVAQLELYVQRVRQMLEEHNFKVYVS